MIRMNLHDIPVDRLVLRRIARRDFRRARLAAEARERLAGRVLDQANADAIDDYVRATLAWAQP